MTARPSVGVGVVVTRGDHVLLVRRRWPPGAGTWSTPGGYLDYGETPAECAVREAAEETGVRVESPRFVAVTNDLFPEDGRHFVTIWMEAAHAGGEAALAAADELSEVRWFSWRDVPQELFPPLARLLAGDSLPPERLGQRQ